MTDIQAWLAPFSMIGPLAAVSDAVRRGDTVAARSAAQAALSQDSIRRAPVGKAMQRWLRETRQQGRVAA